MLNYSVAELRIIKHNIIYLEKLSCFQEDIPLFCEVYNVYISYYFLLKTNHK